MRSSMPTSSAAMTVPMPTLPSPCRKIRQVMSEMMTMDTSNAILTVGNGLPVSVEMASIAPSPASGIMSAGT